MGLWPAFSYSRTPFRRQSLQHPQPWRCLFTWVHPSLQQHYLRLCLCLKTTHYIDNKKIWNIEHYEHWPLTIIAETGPFIDSPAPLSQQPPYMPHLPLLCSPGTCHYWQHIIQHTSQYYSSCNVVTAHSPALRVLVFAASPLQPTDQRLARPKGEPIIIIIFVLQIWQAHYKVTDK